MTDRFDVLIAGSGPVGLALAASLAGTPLKSAIIGSGEQGPARPIALSLGSRQLLERIGAWDDARATPILTVHVSQQGGLGRCLIRHTDLGEAALGHVMAYDTLVRLLDAASPLPRVTGTLREWNAGPDTTRVMIDTPTGESVVETRLLVLAEGGAMLPAARSRNYGQSALVASVTADRPHAGQAWERFTPGGPLALLPDGTRYALVWSASTDAARSLLALSDVEFLDRLSAVADRRAGGFRDVGGRAIFPLLLRRMSAPGPRALAIGNASQALHPVAGQGFNLGLRDAWELAELLRDANGADPGSMAIISRFARLRRLDRDHAVGATDALVRIFSGDQPLARLARGAALLGFDLAAPARDFLARRMMFGMRALP